MNCIKEKPFDLVAACVGLGQSEVRSIVEDHLVTSPIRFRMADHLANAMERESLENLAADEYLYDLAATVALTTSDRVQVDWLRRQLPLVKELLLQQDSLDEWGGSDRLCKVGHYSATPSLQLSNASNAQRQLTCNPDPALTISLGDQVLLGKFHLRIETDDQAISLYLDCQPYRPNAFSAKVAFADMLRSSLSDRCLVISCDNGTIAYPGSLDQAWLVHIQRACALIEQVWPSVAQEVIRDETCRRLIG